METIDLLIVNGLTSAQRTPLEPRVLFTDDIWKVSLKNIEKLRQEHS